MRCLLPAWCYVSRRKGGNAMKAYHFDGEEKIPSPALIYYPEIIAENTRKCIALAGGAQYLWPHVKSHKMEQVLKMQISMGIRRFKCATIKEAAVAAAAGADHILLAYPLVGPNQDRFLELIKQWPDRTFYAVGDDLKQIKMLAGKAKEQGLIIRLFIDVNTGMNRTGVSFEDLPEFCRQLRSISSVELVGFHCYDGERHEYDPEMRKKKVEETIGAVQKLCSETEREGWEPALVMGGSPSFPCYSQEMKGTRIYYSPGTIFIYDAGYGNQFPDLPFKPGAAVLTRVVSHPADGYFTIDCGYKAVSAEQKYPGLLPEAVHAEPAFQSEEHWTFKMQKGYENERPEIGRCMYVMPWHICPTTALYDQVFTAAGGKLSGTWRVSARGRLWETDTKEQNDAGANGV